MDLWLHDMKTGQERRLTQRMGAEMAPSWSADGSRLAFLHDSELETVDVQTGDT
jgi:Tol biopolymer transport system component